MYDRMPHDTCKSPVILNYFLVIAHWFAGCAFGLSLFDTVRDEYVSLMRSSFSTSVSIVGGLTVVFLPFVFTALAVYISKPGFAFFIVFVKSVLFTLATVACYAAFGPGGWLVQLLLLFSDCFGTFMLLLVTFRLLCSGVTRWGRTVLVSLTAGVVILAVDHYLILPIVGRI